MQTYSLNIGNYPKDSQTIDEDGLYWINVERTADALRLLLSAASGGQPVTLFTDADRRADFAALKCPELIEKARVEVIAIRGKCHPLTELARALQYIPEAQNGLVAVLLDSGRVDEIDAKVVHDALCRLYRFVNRNHQAVLVLNIGRFWEHTQAELVRDQTRFRGMATLEDMGPVYRYEVQSWRTKTTLRGESTAFLLLKDGQFVTDARQEGEFSAPDEGLVYTSVNLYGPEHARGALQRLCADNQEVFRQASEAVAATVVFSLDQYAQLQDVARMVHDLRIRRGRRLKIAVLEQGVSLRAISESLLLDCGANTVLKPHGGIGYQQVMVSNLSRQIYTHEVAADFGAVYRELELSGRVGYLPYQEFFDCVTEIISQPGDRRSVHGALVVLTPQEGMDAAEAMMQFAPKRSGDIGTVAGVAAVLYLYGCQEALLGDVLRHVFPIEPHLLFSQYTVVFSDLQVRELLGQMKDSPDWYSSGYVSSHRQSMLDFAHQRSQQRAPAANPHELAELVRSNPVIPHPAAAHQMQSMEQSR